MATAQASITLRSNSSLQLPRESLGKFRTWKFWRISSVTERGEELQNAKYVDSMPFIGTDWPGPISCLSIPILKCTVQPY